VVQLIKRRRDVVFNGDGDAPRSVVLTTLAAGHYSGEDSCCTALQNLLDALCRDIANCQGIMEVRNPTNREEVFSEAWTWQSYSAFREFIFNFREEFRQLRAQVGLDKITKQMEDVFGEELARKAVLSYTNRLSALRETGRLGFGRSAVALAAIGAGVTPIPRTTFFGQ